MLNRWRDSLANVWLKSEMFWMKDKLSVRNTNSGKLGWLDPDLCTEFLQNCGFVTVSRQNLFGISKGYSHNMGNTINLTHSSLWARSRCLGDRLQVQTGGRNHLTSRRSALSEQSCLFVVGHTWHKHNVWKALQTRRVVGTHGSCTLSDDLISPAGQPSLSWRVECALVCSGWRRQERISTATDLILIHRRPTCWLATGCLDLTTH